MKMDVGVWARTATNLAEGLGVMDRCVCQTFLIGCVYLDAQYILPISLFSVYFSISFALVIQLFE